MVSGVMCDKKKMFDKTQFFRTVKSASLQQRIKISVNKQKKLGRILNVAIETNV